MVQYVRCPICKQVLKVRGKKFFRHCGTTFFIRQNSLTSSEIKDLTKKLMLEAEELLKEPSAEKPIEVNEDVGKNISENIGISRKEDDSSRNEQFNRRTNINSNSNTTKKRVGYVFKLED